MGGRGRGIRTGNLLSLRFEGGGVVDEKGSARAGRYGEMRTRKFIYDAPRGVFPNEGSGGISFPAHKTCTKGLIILQNENRLSLTHELSGLAIIRGERDTTRRTLSYVAGALKYATDWTLKDSDVRKGLALHPALCEWIAQFYKQEVTP